MSDELSELYGEIYRLTRGDLDQEEVCFPAPPLPVLLERLEWVRLRRLARFWKSAEGEPAASLEQTVEDLLAGLHGQGQSWMFLLRGVASRSPGETRIECWFGAALLKPGLAAMLRGTFPDARVECGPAPEARWLAGLGHALILTGTPRWSEAEKPPTRADRIERVCRGLYGSNWSYVVHAEPVPGVDILGAANALAERILSVQARYLLKGSAWGDQHRLARQVVELLEARHAQHERGRRCGMWRAQVWLLTDSDSTLARGRALLHGAFAGGRTLLEPVRTCPCRRHVNRGPDLEWLPSGETALLSCPPREEYPGYEVIDSPRFAVAAPPPPAADQATAAVGAVQDRGASTGNALVVPLDDLARHVLIAGVPGSGKTNTCFHLLAQLAEQGVPFLVIEPAKSEYRRLLMDPRFQALRVFTVGDETVSPLRLNPFEVPPGILVQTHIDYLKSLFAAAFVLYPPMPYVLEQSLQEVYQDRGWDLARNTNWRGPDSPRLFPTLSDLVAKVRRVVDRMGYDERITMDVTAGLVARLDGLRLGGGKGPMLDTRRSQSAEVLFKSPCLIELKQMVDDDEKAFVMGLLLIRLYEHHEGGRDSAAGGRGRLRHVTLIEEAHRLLRNVSMEQGSEVAANPRGRAIEVFANLLAEVRAYGEGLLIAEQVPVKLVPDAIKNTNLKIVHRLAAEDDRKAVGSTMNLSEEQSRHLTTLAPGEGVGYTEGMRQPMLLRVPLMTAAGGPGMSGQEVREAPSMRRFWSEHRELRLPFAGCAGCRADVPGRSCGTHQAESVAGLLPVFRRLFNALRLEPELAPASYAAFGRICRQAKGAGRQPLNPYCAFVELTESELTQRGDYGGWDHCAVESAIQLACELATLLDRANREEFVRVQEAFSSLLAALHHSAELPFAGCSVCASPCTYRLDMARSPDHADGARFRSACQIEDHEAMQAELLQACWTAAGEAFDGQAQRGAAICFAAQQLQELPMSADRQQHLTGWIEQQLTEDEVAEF